MDTPTITQYYRESDPARRLALLNMSIEAGEEPELNQIRRELWDIRYQDPSELGGDTRADGLIALWMLMEFNKDSGKRFMEVRGGRKEIMKQLNKMKFQEICSQASLSWKMQFVHFPGGAGDDSKLFFHLQCLRKHHGSIINIRFQLVLGALTTHFHNPKQCAVISLIRLTKLHISLHHMAALSVKKVFILLTLGADFLEL